jgi:hypothetical protein
MGYEAMFIIEDYPQRNPNMHLSSDTIETLNLEFHYKVTRSLVAAIAYMAGLD